MKIVCRSACHTHTGSWISLELTVFHLDENCLQECLPRTHTHKILNLIRVNSVSLGWKWSAGVPATHTHRILNFIRVNSVSLRWNFLSGVPGADGAGGGRHAQELRPCWREIPGWCQQVPQSYPGAACCQAKSGELMQQTVSFVHKGIFFFFKVPPNRNESWVKFSLVVAW